MATLPTAITDLSDYEESINMVVYGDSGVGKTVLAGTCPNALILGVEAGTVSARLQGSTAKLWSVKSWDDLLEAYQWLRRNPDHGFDWVVIDSVTVMQQRALRWILDNAVKENSNRDPDIPAIQDHQKWQNMFRRFVDSFNELPVNVLYTATAVHHEDEEGEDLVLPDITGKGYSIAQYLCQSVNVVAYLGVRQNKKTGERVRRLLAETTPPYFAKDRYNVLVPFIDNPTMVEVSKRIAGVTTSKIERPARTIRKTPRKPATRV